MPLGCAGGQEGSIQPGLGIALGNGHNANDGSLITFTAVNQPAARGFYAGIPRARACCMAVPRRMNQKVDARDE
jgi:hypothetical protein